MESFNAIVEMEVVRRFEFDAFKEALVTIQRFISFYNDERLHSGFGFRSAEEVYEPCVESYIIPIEHMVRLSYSKTNSVQN